MSLDLVTNEICNISPQNLDSHRVLEEARSKICTVVIEGGIEACIPAYLMKKGAPGATAETVGNRIRVTAPASRRKLHAILRKLPGVTVVE